MGWKSWEPGEYYEIWKHEPKTSKIHSTFDWINDSQLCICTNNDENGCYILPKESKLFQYHEGVFEFAPFKHYQ